MILNRHRQSDAKALAEELLRQRDVLLHQAELFATLRANVARYEEKYNVASEDIHRAIDEGRLEETLEVCSWIMDYEIIRDMNDRVLR